MSQSTYAYGATANISGPAFRADHNAMATAIASLNEGTVAPSPTYAGMWWRDIGNALLKQRNSANSAWITIGALDATNLGMLVADNNLSDVSNTLTALSNLGGLAKSGGSMMGALNEAQAANIASASSINIGSISGNFALITGTTSISAMGTAQAGAERVLRFQGSLTLTHNGTSLVLPNAQNLVTEAGDAIALRSLGSGNWVCTSVYRANPFLAASVARTGGNQTGIATATWTKVQYGTKIYDYGTKYDSSANYRWTPGRTGVANISARVGWNTMADGATLGIAIYRNGTTMREHYEPASAGTAGGVNGPTISVDVPVSSVTDYFEIFIYQGSGSDRDILGVSTTTWATFNMLQME